MIFHPIFRSTAAVGASGGGGPPTPSGVVSGWAYPFYGGTPSAKQGYVFVIADHGEDSIDVTRKRGTD